MGEIHMAQLFPKRSQVDVDDRDPQLVGIDDASADELFSALSSQTARALLIELYREATTLSEVAERADTSVQNATHHLRRFEDIGLIEVVDTWYSSRGREMDVYAPTSDPLVFVAGEVENEQVPDDVETPTAAAPPGDNVPDD